MLRILRVLASRTLDCGCFVGVYETYGGVTIAVVDERGACCTEPSHEDGAVLTRADLRCTQPDRNRRLCAVDRVHS